MMPNTFFALTISALLDLLMLSMLLDLDSLDPAALHARNTVT
jgi:hypothetical protein